MYGDAHHAFTMSMKPSANQSHAGSNEATNEKVQNRQQQFELNNLGLQA